MTNSPSPPPSLTMGNSEAPSVVWEVEYNQYVLWFMMMLTMRVKNPYDHYRVTTRVGFDLMAWKFAHLHSPSLA